MEYPRDLIWSGFVKKMDLQVGKPRRRNHQKTPFRINIIHTQARGFAPAQSLQLIAQPLVGGPEERWKREHKGPIV